MIEFVPYQRCGELHFGMSQDQVVTLLGPPQSSRRNWLGATEMFYPLYNVGLGYENSVVEITIHPGTCVLLDGVDIMSLPSGREHLLRTSKDKYLGAGSIVLLDLGIAISDDERARVDQSITVFAKGWEQIEGYKKLP